ncbi:helix-turn-helix domain-containing protein [Litoreibacter roseus]|uniref:helix-turn-helix domain-containing protein n=1 Tax=Litoreibacter roseus TaxID=2601869 RepID=UPI001358D93C|nr:helix-turn-helix domain-containing protein [Litoreibacter roseus]
MLVLNIDRHKQIIERLHERGVSLGMISRTLKKSKSHVTATCQGRTKSALVENEIARQLDCEPSDLWPERYQTTREGRS